MAAFGSEILILAEHRVELGERLLSEPQFYLFKTFLIIFYHAEQQKNTEDI